MSTFKLKIELPTREKFVEGLTPGAPHEAYPPLVRAEETVATAERALDGRRRNLADRERHVAELPARIQRGEVRASALVDALRERDAAALLVPPAEDAATSARSRLAAEKKNAIAAGSKEFARRVELLEAAAAQVAPVLDEINELAMALAATAGPGAFLASIEWASSPADDARMRMAAHATLMPLAYATSGAAK